MKCPSCHGTNEDAAAVCIYCGQDFDQPGLMGKILGVFGGEARTYSPTEDEPLEQENNWEEAIAKYGEAIRLDPEYTEAYFSRGEAYLNLGQIDRAIQDYDEAIGQDPEDAEAYFNRGVAYFNVGEYRSAFDSYNEAIQLDSEDGEVYAHEALAATLLGRDEEAEIFVKQAVELGIAPTLLEVVIEELKKRR